LSPVALNAGVDAGAGVTAPDLGEAGAARRMLETTERRVVLAAGTSVGTVQMAPACALDEVEVRNTAPDADSTALDALRTRGVEVVAT